MPTQAPSAHKPGGFPVPQKREAKTVSTENAKPIGQTLDNLGVTQELSDGDLITDALVLTKIVGPDGRVQLGIATSEGMSWLDKLGLAHAYLQVDNQSGLERADDD
jgi:hypothetical protein